LLTGVEEGGRNDALTRISGSIIGKGFTYDAKSGVDWTPIPICLGQ